MTRKIPDIIGIRFKDNDFTLTIEAFLNTILLNKIEKYGDPYGDLTKEHIVDLFNKSASGLYWINQNKLNYISEDFNPALYLIIKTENVFFDSEVVEYIKEKNDWCNGEFHVLDRYSSFKQVYSV